MTPIFILSLPRSGSTLLQRILTAHGSIASTGEPWILLPLVYAGRKTGQATEYGHASAYRSHQELLKNLPKGREDYLACCAAMAKDVYRRVSGGGEPYFLDKTPRYYRIIPELLEMFPEGRFIFLFRSPVAVTASLLSFHGRKARYLYLSRDDVVKGSILLDAGAELAGARAISVGYERLVCDPESEVRRVMDYLCLPYHPTQLTSFTNVTLGRGDPFGTKQYRSVDSVTIERWRSTLDTPFLRRLTSRWLQEIGDAVLARQGYALDELLAEVECGMPVWRPASTRDWFDYQLGHIYAKLHLNLLLGGSGTRGFLS